MNSHKGAEENFNLNNIAKDSGDALTIFLGGEVEEKKIETATDPIKSEKQLERELQDILVRSFNFQRKRKNYRKEENDASNTGNHVYKPEPVQITGHRWDINMFPQSSREDQKGSRYESRIKKYVKIALALMFLSLVGEEAYDVALNHSRNFNQTFNINPNLQESNNHKLIYSKSDSSMPYGFPYSDTSITNSAIITTQGFGCTSFATNGNFEEKDMRCAGIGSGRMHEGIDLVTTATDKSVLATMDGTVIEAGPKADGYGIRVFIQGDDGSFEERFCHLNDISVIAGTHVKAGQKIGDEGWTGAVSPAGPKGEHLHFEIYIKGTDGLFYTIDPTNFIYTRHDDNSKESKIWAGGWNGDLSEEDFQYKDNKTSELTQDANGLEIEFKDSPSITFKQFIKYLKTNNFAPLNPYVINSEHKGVQNELSRKPPYDYKQGFPFTKANAYSKEEALQLIKDMYQECLNTHVDPAFILAMYKHESNLGNIGVARETKALGNIRPGSADQSSVYIQNSQSALTAFDSRGNGLFRAYNNGYIDATTDLCNILKIDYGTGKINNKKLTTVQLIIPVWAPSGDHNDPDSYIRTVISIMQDIQKIQ